MEKLPKNPVIGIVGGRGEMGSCFRNFFERQGFKNILISGRNPDDKEVISNKELAQKADVVIISVTLENTVDVINEIAPLLNHDQFLIDLSSIKTPQVEAMRESKAEVLGTHPMFGGGVSFSGQVVVVCPARVKKWKGWLENLLEKEGAKIIELDPAEHDRRVPFLQALPHFLGFVFAETLKKGGESIEEIRELVTPNAKILLDFAARVISQNPKLIHEIQKANPQNFEMREILENSFQKWRELTNSADFAKFEKSLAENKIFFGEFLKEGNEEAQLFLDTIARRNLKMEEFEKPCGTPKKDEKNQKPFAIFGGKISNTDEAARKFFWKTERRGDFSKHFSSIRAVFEAVKKGEARGGIAPLENETGGIIRETFDQLLENKGEIKIRTLVESEIHHALIVSPETDAANIETIYSHPQALSQCAENILKECPLAKTVATNSTIEALEKIKNLKNVAALGPKKAAEEMGLKIIKQNFEDRAQNRTTFAVIAKNWSRLSMSHTLVAFQFSENKPGQLADILDIFRDKKVNLSKIISIPRAKNEFDFFIELENSTGTAAALKEAEKKSATLFKFSNYQKI